MNSSHTVYPEKSDVIKTYVHVSAGSRRFDTASIHIGELWLYFPFEHTSHQPDRMTFGQFADQINIAIEKIFEDRQAHIEALETEEEEASNE